MNLEDEAEKDPLTRLLRSTIDTLGVRSERSFPVPMAPTTNGEPPSVFTGFRIGLDGVRGAFDRHLNQGSFTLENDRYFHINHVSPITLINGDKCREIIVSYDDDKRIGASVMFMVRGDPDPSLTERSLGLFDLQDTQSGGTVAGADTRDAESEVCRVRFIENAEAWVELPQRRHYGSDATRTLWPLSSNCSFKLFSRFIDAPAGSETMAGPLNAVYHHNMSTLQPHRSVATGPVPFLYTLTHPQAQQTAGEPGSQTDRQMRILEYYVLLDVVPRLPSTVQNYFYDVGISS